MGNASRKKKTSEPLQQPVIPEWDFETWEIGGLDEQMQTICRRLSATRNDSADAARDLGSTNVKGILLYGRPGCGKTLILQQIATMLKDWKPRLVNASELLSRYDGQSEANIRDLFPPAEDEQQRVGANSDLHIILIDDIDALCIFRPHGSMAGSSGVAVVSQLITMLDAVKQPNVVVIATTNRLDLIEEALLRPGRLELMEIGLPDENGREQILKIHTKKMHERGMLATDVDILLLAKLTKNYTGAEVESLVWAAFYRAHKRYIQQPINLPKKRIHRMQVKMQDFTARLHGLD